MTGSFVLSSVGLIKMVRFHEGVGQLTSPPQPVIIGVSLVTPPVPMDVLCASTRADRVRHCHQRAAGRHGGAVVRRAHGAHPGGREGRLVVPGMAAGRSST